MLIYFENVLFTNGFFNLASTGANITITNSSGLFYADSSLVDPNLSDIQIKNSNVGGLSSSAGNTLLESCTFTNQIFIYSQTSKIQNCLFSSIRAPSSILEIISSTCVLQNNKFINNTISTYSLLDLLGSDGSLTGNYFSCNMLTTNSSSSVAAVLLPSFITAYSKEWMISSNTMDPSCPYECSPGYEPVFNGISCSQCAKGFISSGHTSPCTPCPGGFFLTSDSNNCTLSIYGILICALGGIILLIVIIIVGASYVRWRKKEYALVN